MVHGAGAGQALIRAGELDEIEVHIVPVLLGSGRRLLDLLDDLPEPVELHLVRVLEGRDAAPVRYRVVRPS
jgi:riboflavin biosynthesis pyrimidine reductase